MGMTLDEYAAKNPMPEPEAERQAIADTARSYQERQQERETVEQLKASIAQQLQAGSAPQLILYAAVKAIGLLTHDEAWAQEQRQALDGVYDDLAQESLLTDNAAAAAARLDAKRTQYIDRLRRQLTTQLNGCKRIETALRDALQAANAVDPPEEADSEADILP